MIVPVNIVGDDITVFITITESDFIFNCIFPVHFVHTTAAHPVHRLTLTSLTDLGERPWTFHIEKIR